MGTTFIIIIPFVLLKTPYKYLLYTKEICQFNLLTIMKFKRQRDLQQLTIGIKWMCIAVSPIA